MTSIGTFSKQIPLNNGYFRVVPALVVTTVTNGGGTAPTPISSFMFTFNSDVLGGYTPPNPAVQLLLSSGQCLLKDMGVNYVFPGTNGVGTGSGYNTAIQYRRVQVVDSGATNTDGVSGNASGLDSDYNVAYIQLGLKGNAVPGPFIRTG